MERRDSTKIPRNKRTGLKLVAIWSLIAVIFITELFLYTWCRVQCVKTGYEISKETDRRIKLSSLQNNLKVEIAHLKSPQRIANIAAAQLGLIIPTPEKIITIP
jgi:cell division protein FtsL